MPEISDAVWPWILLIGCWAATAIGAAAAVAIDRLWHNTMPRLVAKLSGMPTRIAPFGCVDCGVGDNQPHRHGGCPENVRQIERELDITLKEQTDA